MCPESNPRRRRRMDDARCIRDVLHFEIRCARQELLLLPDEREIAQRLGCSRNAMREALSLLRSEEVIERRQGAGTVVVGESAPLMVTEFCGLLQENPGEETNLRHELLSVREISARGPIGALLGLGDDESILVLTRRSLIDGTPAFLWDNYVPYEVGVQITARASTEAYLDIFRDVLGIQIADVSRRIEAVLADTSVADILQVAIGQPLLHIEAVLSDTNGCVVALAFGRARADRVSLSIHSHLIEESSQPPEGVRRTRTKTVREIA